MLFQRQVVALQGGEETLDGLFCPQTLEMFWPTLQQPAELWTNGCESHTPPHAATPRIQVSDSLYFTLYFTMHGDAPLTRHGILYFSN
jgi:hypothetical protein